MIARVSTNPVRAHAIGRLTHPALLPICRSAPWPRRGPPEARLGSETHFFRALTNLAETEMFAVRVTVQVPVPLHPPPLQPEKRLPFVGVAVSVTTVPLG